MPMTSDTGFSGSTAHLGARSADSSFGCSGGGREGIVSDMPQTTDVNSTAIRVLGCVVLMLLGFTLLGALAATLMPGMGGASVAGIGAFVGAAFGLICIVPITFIIYEKPIARAATIVFIPTTVLTCLVSISGQGMPLASMGTCWAVSFLMAILVGIMLPDVPRPAPPPRTPSCPGCGYDVRGLRMGVCPECGAARDRQPPSSSAA